MELEAVVVDWPLLVTTEILRTLCGIHSTAVSSDSQRDSLGVAVMGTHDY